MVGHGGSSASSYLADPTSPIPSHCASIVATSTLRVNFAAFADLFHEDVWLLLRIRHLILYPNDIETVLLYNSEVKEHQRNYASLDHWSRCKSRQLTLEVLVTTVDALGRF